MPAERFLAIEGLSKSFGATRVLSDLSLDVNGGEIVALLGRSGSGKSTLLRLVAGFEEPDRGVIRVAGRDVGGLPANRRGFGMVFQSYALFPHLTVGENVAFGLESLRWPKAEIESRVPEMLRLVDLDGFSKRPVSAISGGQQQRVALARALASRPRLLMLDEPLSNLDPSLRERTRAELRAAIREVGITTLLVTHEQEEAFDVGDRVALLNDGRLEQVATPRDLYERPETRFVAEFVGRSSPLPGRLEVSGSALRVRLELGEGSPTWPAESSKGTEPGARVDLLVRPEALELREARGADAVAARVIAERYGGASSYLIVELTAASSTDARRLEVMTERAVKVGTEVWVGPRTAARRPIAFPARQQK